MPSTTLIENAMAYNASHPLQTQAGAHLTLATAIVNSFATTIGIIDTLNGFAGIPTTSGHFAIETTVVGLLKGDGTGVSAAVPGVDYLAPVGLVGSGILLSTTGVLSIAGPGDFPTLNQSTTGNAATATALQVPRLINGIPFDGTGDITIATFSGTVTDVSVANANGFTGSVVNSTANAIISVGTTISGILKGNGSAISAAANSDITGVPLTGYVSSTGAITSSDSILQAIQKLNGNIGLLSGSMLYKGLWNASTNIPNLTSGVGTTGYMYKVSVAGGAIIDGIGNWNVGDFIIFDGTVWDKLDGVPTEVLSVNGLIGAVTLTTGLIGESSNLYYTNARAIGATLTGYTSGAGVISSADTVLQAIQKLNGNIGAMSVSIDSTLASTSGVIGLNLASTNFWQAPIKWDTGLGAISHIKGPTDQDLSISSGGGSKSINFQINGSTVVQLSFGGGFYWSNGLGAATHIYGPNDQNLRISSQTAGNGIDFGLSGVVKFSLLSNGDLSLKGATSGSFNWRAAATTTTYTAVMPSAQGAANTILTNDGAGLLSWSAPASVSFGSLTGVPTTLSGYGITDAYTKTASDARYWQSGALTAQVTWTTGLGAITQLLGPTDQAFIIRGGLDATANSSGKDLNLYTQYGTLGGAGSAVAGNINIITGQSGSPTFAGGNIVITGNTGTNSGSPGGQVSITSNGKSAAGSGSIGMALLCNTGHLTIGTGASGSVTGNVTLFTPTIVSAGSGGNQAGGLIATTGGGQSSGGSGTINGIGGQGGTYNVNIGAGGVAGGSGDATHLTITGGNAGLYSIIFGAGGACSTSTGFSGATHTGGNSTVATFTGAAGGASNGSLSGSIHTGGNGTSYLFTGGNGGSATGLLGTNTGGNGGGYIFQTGAGGVGTTANGTAGSILFNIGGANTKLSIDATGKINFLGGDAVLSANITLDYSVGVSNATAGTATLVAGTVTVSTTAVKASDIIIITGNAVSGSSSVHYAPTASIVAGTSFVINARNAGATTLNTSDTSTVNWFILHTH